MRKLWKLRWLKVTLLVVAVGLVSAGVFVLVTLRPENRCRLYWGWRNMAVVQGADEVTLYHIESDYQWQQHVIGKPVTASPALARRLKALVADPKNYTFPDPYECLPTPNVLVQFHRGRETANAFFCFSCREVFIGESREYTTFDPMWSQMVAVVQEAFPHDPDLQFRRRPRRSGRGTSPK